jgi:HSP20 family molecular chaperone IbpA
MTDTTLASRRLAHRQAAPFGGMPRSFFDSPFLNRFMELNPTNNLMRSTVKEDGSTILEYNLAGFESGDISVHVDTASNELIIHALSEVEDNRRMFNTTIGISPYTTPEDVSTAYKNGVLQILIAPLEKRKAESLVPIPVGSVIASYANEGEANSNVESLADHRKSETEDKS